MTLPSQTARSGYRRNHMFRSKGGSSAKLIIAGLVIATVAIVVWVIIAKRMGESTPPPAVVTNDTPQDSKAQSDTPTKSVAQQRDNTPAQQPADQQHESRIVMGDNTVRLPEPLEQPSAALNKPEQQTTTTNEPAPKQPETKPEVTPKQTAPQESAPRAVTGAQRLLDEGARQANAGRLVEARQTLSMALEQLDPYGRDAGVAREMLGEINKVLVFSDKVAPNDPFARSHKVQSGQVLSTIARQYGVDWRFIARINNISDPSKLQAGQALKVIDGRFHAVVRKSAYELDLYIGEGSDRVFVRTFSVGLGELDSTPIGRFAVESRVANPSWKNPRTGEYFGQDDPKNPIGEFWVGLKGIEEKTKGMDGYGIHGTIEPDSIGKQQSMGCVRMLPEDIALVFEVLISDLNTIEVVP